jgi:transposase-like protein
MCACGGSVRLHLNGLRPGQRLGEDWSALVPHWAGLAYSLREMKRTVDAALGSSVGLRSLNQRLQQVAAQVPAWYQRELAQVPPVVVLDGVWVTLMEPSGAVDTDRRGRRRAVKTRLRRPVLIALGVWPEDGRSAVLDWELGDRAGEDQASWLRLLNRLELRGLRPQRGLRLFVHDGGAGLIAALRDLFWDVPHQRCVFHKLRNVWQAISLSPDQAPEAARAERRRLIRQAARIWQAPTRDEALRRFQDFCRTWQASQPAAVLTLQRDFADTLTFYALLEHQRLWKARALRTTSWLERLNRALRARFRKAGAFHSRAGLEVVLVQVLGVH